MFGVSVLPFGAVTHQVVEVWNTSLESSRVHSTHFHSCTDISVPGPAACNSNQFRTKAREGHLVYAVACVLWIGRISALSHVLVLKAKKHKSLFFLASGQGSV